jgi:glycosyltransferase involved in cell wall biosynthesis
MDTLVKKIKIAQVITRLDKGGAPEIVLYITRGLDPVRFETTLISGLTKDAQASPEEIKKWGIEYVNIPSLRRQIDLIFDVVAFFRLYALFRRKRFDIVHTHTSKAGALGRLAARCAGVPVIIHTPHGHVFYGYFRPLMNRLLVWVEKFLTYFCDKITTLTDHEKSDLMRFGIAKEDKLSVIYNGLELEKFYQNTVDIAQMK